jgi:hypothetical protein
MAALWGSVLWPPGVPLKADVDGYLTVLKENDVDNALVFVINPSKIPNI